MEATTDDPCPKLKNMISYKNFLLSTLGIGKENMEDIDQLNHINKDSASPEDRWYREEADPLKENEAFDSCPVISISKEEFDEWYKL
ncbi:hypothetical protein AHAS_Ahas18G0129300 [Arachis hypogaea]